jgi:hypothetical protein
MDFPLPTKFFLFSLEEAKEEEVMLLLFRVCSDIDHLPHGSVVKVRMPRCNVKRYAQLSYILFDWPRQESES